MKQIGHYTYDEINCLGQGAYGKVYEGLNTLNNETVAIKKLDLILFEKDKIIQVQEIEIMSKLNHKNIVKFVELLATKKSLFIVTEMCRSGDLKSLIASKNISEQQAIDIMLQILEGFKELIKSGVIHRDMKPANVLNDMGTVKIADFGFAKYVENYSSQLLKSCVGSPLYMAPQVLERHHYSTKCDIWSLGVIFYEMLHFDVPWKGRDEEDLLHNIKTQPLQFKNDLSKFSKQFLTITLVIEEENRASWNQIFDLSHTSELQKSVSAEDINEESIQKLPTWIQRPSISQRQDKKVDEQKYQQIEELQSLRKQIAYQHFIMTECYTEQINNENNGELQQESIKQLLNYINENIVKESYDLIQASVDLYQKMQQKNLLWKMQEQLNAEHNYYMQMQIDAKKLFALNQYQGKPDDKQINEAKIQLQKCKSSNAASMLLDLINNSNWKK
ncbi:unnamed protein product (macronuclear) [Paramecium tetraurelia]|uniref:Protein kinase domain-containing protein n=1 Tax=Paramecium tetraurelia TaxID=5888 RepID=A0E776_PARTE|nr:uncharacterized protein GSPATT00023871001 [Paramecium tetraurelia]CAK91143.1 unnamed protein product [Paramecium tetraurelia]|eukprot:XP_001458540.1 hypothetical protein (macronuclear) [Paramecium tetraurelia strain d4-2]